MQKQIRPDLFAHTLGLMRGGTAAAELNEKLAALCTACGETGRVGEIKLVIKVKPNGAGSGQFTFIDTVTVKAPEHDRPATLLFEDEHGNLQREDPRQERLPLRSAPEPGLRRAAAE